MKLDRDIMIDLETLATTPDSVVLTIAGIRFNHSKDYKNIRNPYDMDFFYCRVNTDDQTQRYIDPDTLAWWAKQDEDIKAEAFDTDNRLSLNDAMTAFNYWARGGDRYWANGSAFDFPILESCNANLGNANPWRYWQVMDARTIFKIVSNHYVPTQSKHHALFDCLNQIQRLTDCLSRLKIDKVS